MRRWPCAGTGGVRSSVAPSTLSGRYCPWKCTCSSWSVVLNTSTEVCRPCWNRSNGLGKSPLYSVVDTNRSGASSSTPVAMRKVCSALPTSGTGGAEDMAWVTSAAAAPAAGNMPAASADRLAVFRKSRRSMAVPPLNANENYKRLRWNRHGIARQAATAVALSKSGRASGVAGDLAWLALIARAENHVPQTGGHAEVGVGVVVVDVVETGPAAHQWALESMHVDHDMAQPVGGVARRDGAGQQQRVARGNGQREHGAQQAHEQWRHEERQRVIAERIIVMMIVAGFERSRVAMEQPAMGGVFDEGEGKQAAQRGERRQHRLHVSVPDAGRDQQQADQAVRNEARTQVEQAGGQPCQRPREPFQRRRQAPRRIDRCVAVGGNLRVVRHGQSQLLG